MDKSKLQLARRALAPKFRLNPLRQYILTMIQQNTSVGYDSKVEGEVIVTRADSVINWIRKHSVWPMPMGLACCAIELMAAGGSRFDISRFGMEVMRFSPRQADCMIVAGTVTYKMAEVIRRIYEQMAEPKWVVAMGACASTGGMYRSYATLQGVDRVVPVDVYVSGCPPRPEALLDAMMKLQDKIGRENAVKDLKATNEVLAATPGARVGA
jgi:NADH-quinone oxidoreductase subunit B|tara:strand:- start:4730 stop:5365 length:636 start_codon:yes stop_codon:yes gene_type:complete